MLDTVATQARLPVLTHKLEQIVHPVYEEDVAFGKFRVRP
jgi:hypothetical protein